MKQLMRRLWHYLFSHSIDRSFQESHICACGLTLKAMCLTPDKSYAGLAIRLWWRLGNWWRDYSPRQLLRTARWFVQRGRRGYADCDYIGMNVYLAGIILGLFKQLRENYTSFPVDMPERTWGENLDTMIAGFQDIVDQKDGWENDPAVTRELLRFALAYADLWD